MTVFNIHKNVTADGVEITPGLRVFTNELAVGVVTIDRNQDRCCERGEAGGHPKAQMYQTDPRGWFTDHRAGDACPRCRHNHWFNVTYDEGGGGMFDGERMATTFEGRKA